MQIVRISIAIFLYLASTISNANSIDNCEQQQCRAIVDIGSTGSRVHVYSYDLDDSGSPINITERWSKKINPGFATIEPTKANVNFYLNQLFADSNYHQIPTYLYATAGMRLLPKPKQDQLHVLAKEWFNNQSDWQLIESKTISGADEGLYGWLAINYQLGTLAKNTTPVGVLDMGGASVQISFPVDKAEDINNQDIQEIDLYGRHFKIFIHSFLGLGQTEVSHQFFDSPACFITNYELSSGQLADGDAFTCEKEVSTLINKVHAINKRIYPAITANPVNDWYVMGGAADLVQSRPFNFANKQFTNQELLEKAQTDLCQQPWSTISEQNPNDDYLYGYCLFPAYYYALMVEGYGIPPEKPLNYRTSNQGGDWTMGVILHQHI